MGNRACVEANLHVGVVAGRVRCLAFVAAEFSLCFLFLSGPSYGNGQGLEYDSHAPGMRWRQGKKAFCCRTGSQLNMESKQFPLCLGY